MEFDLSVPGRFDYMSFAGTSWIGVPALLLNRVPGLCIIADVA